MDDVEPTPEMLNLAHEVARLHIHAKRSYGEWVAMIPADQYSPQERATQASRMQRRANGSYMTALFELKRLCKGNQELYESLMRGALVATATDG